MASLLWKSKAPLRRLSRDEWNKIAAYAKAHDVDVYSGKEAEDLLIFDARTGGAVNCWSVRTWFGEGSLHGTFYPRFEECGVSVIFDPGLNHENGILLDWSEWMANRAFQVICQRAGVDGTSDNRPIFLNQILAERTL